MGYTSSYNPLIRYVVQQHWPGENTDCMSGFLEELLTWWIGLELRSHERNQWVAFLNIETIFMNQVQYNHACLSFFDCVEFKE